MLAALLCLACPMAAGASEPPTGVAVKYRLPVDGAGPTTYRVTLAIVDPKNPNWIVSQFACGVVRTATRENQGRFTEYWNGLDDNFMPVPPGTYGVKGICMPAKRWRVDSEFHTITPQFVTGASAWMPGPTQWDKPEPFGGDPVGAPLRAVSVGSNGHAVFYYEYLENGTNNALVDLNRPIGYSQLLRAYWSGGVGGGPCAATDGETVWSVCAVAGPQFVYRADQKPFGTGKASRDRVFIPEGCVSAIAAARDRATGKAFVFVAQRGRQQQTGPRRWTESDRDFVNRVTVLNGADGSVVRNLTLRLPMALAVRGDALYALHALDWEGSRSDFAVSSIGLVGGVPRGGWTMRFVVPAGIHPFDLAVDSRGRCYLSDPHANRVYQLDAAGKLLRTIGRTPGQQPGAYDPLTLMSPEKLASWRDAGGEDRLIVVEQGGPNRVSEWSSNGELLREFLSLQTNSNSGYAVDPEHPDQLYILGHENWLVRFKVDFEHGRWTVDAVWPHVGDDPKAPGFDHPKLIRRNGREYLACARSYNVYRREGSRWILSAAIVREGFPGRQHCFLWHDEIGDGSVRESEYRSNPLPMPGRLLRYHGEEWLDDLSLVAIDEGGRDVWRLAPHGFDSFGNPVFGAWQRLFADPVFEARAAGAADSVHGGNELDNTFTSDWAMATGAMDEGFYVVARGGPNFGANFGGQVRISRYEPDGKGGYRLLWRTGRAAVRHVAAPGEIYGPIHLHAPIDGILSIVDQSRCGIVLFTQDGLYVDTLFPDGRRFSSQASGIYPQPGEFFAGDVVADPASGRIYLAMGKFTPLIFQAEGWSLRENPVRRLADLQPEVTIDAARIAPPPEIALAMRGGAGRARIARFAPALGGAALDGSLDGWESCDPVEFQSDGDHTVEVRCLYDAEHLYLRWHARLGAPFNPLPLEAPERILAGGLFRDTLSFYVQGDPNARSGGAADGRSGDARFVFAVVSDAGRERPVVVGFYPGWTDSGNMQTYSSPVGRVSFAHVGPVAGARLGILRDADGRGFVLTAALPRSAIPGLPPFDASVRTMVDFEATFGGHNKFWWANSDGSAGIETYDEPSQARLYPGAWAPAQFQGFEQGLVVRNWLICGPFGGPGAETLAWDLSGPDKERARKLLDAADYPPDSGHVSVNDTFQGSEVQGYWRDPGTVRWRTATVEPVDTRVALGDAGQVWYAAAWIHVPANMDMEFHLEGHSQTYARFYVNGQIAYQGEIGNGRAGEPGPACVARAALRSGWNRLLFRGYCVGYPPLRLGLVLAASPNQLWSVRLSAAPPK